MNLSDRMDAVEAIAAGVPTLTLTADDRLEAAGHYVRRPTGPVSQSWQRNGYQEGLLDALAALERGGEDGLRTWCRDNLDGRMVRALGPLVQA